jgi:hypothetical protein
VEQLDGGEGHGDAGFHVEGARAPEAAIADAARHGMEGAEGPNRVEVPKEENRAGEAARWRRPRAKANLENVAELALAVKMHAAAELAGVRRGEGHAGVDVGLGVGGRFGENQVASQREKALLLAPRPSQQGAHGNGCFLSYFHSWSLSGQRTVAAMAETELILRG